MAFIAALFQTIIKMAVVGAVAFGGIILGKKLKDKKNAEDQSLVEGKIWQGNYSH